MLTINAKTRTPKAADPVSVGIGSTLFTPVGSVAFSGLEKGISMDPVFEGGALTANPNYPAGAEASDGSPVATGEDFTVICSWCSFLCHLGRGPVKHELCNLCKLDLELHPEVTNA
jgi:hypothetical protein